MFRHPCCFVNRNMFYGTFAQSVVVRVGEARAAALAKKPPAHIFEPMPGRAWREYVQFDVEAVPIATVAKLAAEALAHTAALPPKPAKKAAAKASAAKKPARRK
jgi:hypothetical protein